MTVHPADHRRRARPAPRAPPEPLDRAGLARGHGTGRSSRAGSSSTRCRGPRTQGEEFEAGGETGRITELDPPRRLAWTWGPERYSFDLSAAGDDTTTLVFTHVFNPELGPGYQHAAGWDAYFDRLEAHLARRLPQRGGRPPRAWTSGSRATASASRRPRAARSAPRPRPSRRRTAARGRSPARPWRSRTRPRSARPGSPPRAEAAGGASSVVGLLRPARDRRHERRRRARLLGRGEPHRRDDPQVVRQRDRRAEHDRDAEERVVVVDRRLDQVDLPEEARGRREAGRARASRSSSATRATAARRPARAARAGRRRTASRARARPRPRTPPGS